MTIASIGAVAQSLVPGQSARQVTPPLGLGFRFTVEIGGLQLGSWQACSGLSVDFQPMEVKSGGDYVGTRYLAGEAKYGRIVLKRAASLDSSATVQSWLDTHARAWMTGGARDDVSGVITLFDSNDDPVLRWELIGVHPAAWKGPDLDASSSKVALETLELVHEGFTVSRGSSPPTHPQAPTRSVLTLTGPDGTVEFKYAPVKVTVTRNQDAAILSDQSTVDGPHAVGGDSGVTTGLQLGGKPNVTAYSFSNLVLEGTGVTADVGKLLAWSTKSVVGSSPRPVLPPVDFTFGSGLRGQALNLTSLSLQYTRFDAQGQPSRAMVTTLKLEEPKRVPSTSGAPRQGARNPSSGGIAGRSVHVLRQPESLAALAQQTYGDAAAWREIAAANGIDDPMRVRPGTTVYLPAPSEVGSR